MLLADALSAAVLPAVLSAAVLLGGEWYAGGERRGPTTAASASRLTPSASSRPLVPAPPDAPAGAAMSERMTLAAISASHRAMVSGR